MLNRSIDERVLILEHTCRMLEARIDGLVAALALIPGAKDISSEAASKIITDITGGNIVSGHSPIYNSKTDMEGQAKMIVGQVRTFGQP